MGVSGLLPLLKSIHRQTELKKFAGETIGVDAYGWLHRGAISCALELAQGKPTRKYVDFAMHRVRMLRHFGVTPYLVFDGDFLPSKAMTEGSRAKRRDDSKKLGMELLKAGKPAQAFNEFQKAIDVTPEMARNLIDELKQLQVHYVVAPYEADSQLVYLERQGLISGILSEDSDLLVFGCKRLLTKLDQYGNCIEVNRRDFCAVREVSLTGWTDADFRRMAILSGCDYLAGVNNMGLKTAYRMIRKHKSPERLIRMMQFEGKHRVPEDYYSQFTKAELTFLHQRVFCPQKQEMVFLTEPQAGQGVEDMPFIGAYVEPDIARGVASGELNPMTKQIIVPAPMPESKRRHSQSVSRVANQASANTSSPSAAAAAASATAASHDGPPGKPIDSYFQKHRRIPMGAMDPNCFSVDPQRVAALTHGGLVPRVYPLPRPYVDEPATASAASDARSRSSSPSTSARQLRRRSEPIGTLLARASGTHTDASRRQTTGIPSSSAAEIDALMMGSGQRPQKKARLCADQNVQEEFVDETQRSKFFPTSDKETAHKKGKDAFLFSDDSIDEALLKLPDIDGWHEPAKPRRSITVFEESRTQSTETTTDDGTQLSLQADDEAPTTSTEPPALEQSPARDIAAGPEDVVGTTPAASLQQFAYTPGSSVLSRQTPASTDTQPRSPIFTPSTGAPSTVASSLAASTGTRSTAASRASVLTPLQRIGARALQPKRTPVKKARSPKSSPQKRGLRNALASMPVNPSFVPLPKVDLEEVEALNEPVGSEDCIVPDSDEENDMDESKLAGVEEPEPTNTRSLNLSRFAYG